MADIDGDGKTDILTPNGWFRNIDADMDKWEWHGDWKMEDAGFPIIGYDVNARRQNGSHLRAGTQLRHLLARTAGRRRRPPWVKHTIDESFSQVHALKIADIDGDGEPELIAGKRYRGHNGR